MINAEVKETRDASDVCVH